MEIDGTSEEVFQVAMVLEPVHLREELNSLYAGEIGWRQASKEATESGLL